jgi:hypothetical protein
MNTKFFQFLAWCWFGSMLICIIMEGAGTTYITGIAGTHQVRSVINDLSPFTLYSIGSLSIPVFNPTFFRGVFRLLTWDYSFYTGYYQIIRFFWMAIFSGSAAWGIATNFIQLYSLIASLFRWIVGLL